MPDINLVCRDCQSPFVFTEGEQEFFKQREYQTPKRCKKCRQLKKAQQKEREMDQR